jgi:uncharacterized SAM-binding protein YcdF (DUF218 family)
MQCLKRCTAALLIAASALAGACASALYFAPRWLNDPDVPEKASAILVLAGDPARALEAADLYRSGYAPRIYFSAGVRDLAAQRLDELGITLPREEDLTRQVLTKRGVPEAAVELLGRDLVSTAHEARVLAQRMAGVPGPIIVVTSPYHIRRARLIFRRALPEGPRLLFVGSRYERLPDDWWTDQTSARNVVLELAKTVYYLAGGRF